MRKKIIALIILLCYAALLIKLMVFKDLPTIQIGFIKLNFGGTQVGKANLIPFKTIIPYLLGYKGLIIAGINIIGNIILLVPMGILVPIIFTKTNWKYISLLAIISGLSIECTQVILQVGIFDIDDVILNAFGVLIGYKLFILFQHFRQILFEKYQIATALFLIFFTATIYFLFIHAGSPWSIRFEKAETKLVNLKLNKSDPANLEDPCGGTGGTGIIIGTEIDNIRIKRKDGFIEQIFFNKETIIKNASGVLVFSDLKLNQHVTVVVGLEQNGKRVASHILVCN